MNTGETLLQFEQIRAVKARYCRFLDTKDWDGLTSLFTVDAILDVSADTGLEPITGRDALVKLIRGFVAEATTVHQVHSPEITLTGSDAATGIWAMQDRVVWPEGKSPPGVTSFTGYGHYHEQYARHAGVWLIATLKLTRLYIDPDAATPNHS